MCDHGFAEVVEKEKEVNENDNTFLAYDSKKKEFMEFCDHICHPPMSSEHKYKVTPDKIYNFYFFNLVVVNIKLVGKKKMHLHLLEKIMTIFSRIQIGVPRSHLVLMV